MATRRGPDESVRVACSGDFGASHWTNVFWFTSTHTTAIDTATMNTLCGNIHDLVGANYVQNMHVDSVLQDTKATYFPTGSDLVVVGEHTGSIPGGVSEVDPLPASVAAVLSWQAGVYWRGGKPRTYVGGLPASAVENETTLDPTLVGTLLANGDDLISGFNALASGNFNSLTFSLVSFFTGGELRTPPIAYPIAGVAVHPRIDTQRRRLGK